MKVIFLKHPFPNGEVDIFAYFPYERADLQGNYTSYAHIGQHSACSPAYAAESVEATPAEYGGLLEELRGIYDNLAILNGKNYLKTIQKSL